MVFLFLRRWGATATIAVSMPVCILTVFVLMNVFHLTLNMMSLGGIAMGVGMIVDNSIVVLENIYRYSSEGHSRLESCVEGTKEVFTSLTASTLTTVAVFLPLGLTGGMAGMLFDDFCLTISFLILGSLVIAITLVPLLFVQLQPHERTDFVAYRIMGRVEERYGNVIAKLLHKRKLVVSAAVLLLVLAVVLFAMVPQELMPSMSSGNINLSVTTKNGLNLESTNEIMSSWKKW